MSHCAGSMFSQTAVSIKWLLRGLCITGTVPSERSVYSLMYCSFPILNALIQMRVIYHSSRREADLKCHPQQVHPVHCISFVGRCLHVTLFCEYECTTAYNPTGCPFFFLHVCLFSLLCLLSSVTFSHS